MPRDPIRPRMRPVPPCMRPSVRHSSSAWRDRISDSFHAARLAVQPAYAVGGAGGFGAPGAFGAPGIEGAGAAGAGAAGAATASSLPHSEHSMAPAMFISPQCGHLIRSSGSSAPHFTHFSATEGLIMPHSGHVFGVEAAAGLKHMAFLLSFRICEKPVGAGAAQAARSPEPTVSYGMRSVVLRSRSAILAASSSIGPYSIALARQWSWHAGTPPAATRSAHRSQYEVISG